MEIKKNKYWGVWDKNKKLWWSPHREKIEITTLANKTNVYLSLDWGNLVEASKIINHIPIWDRPDIILKCPLLPSFFEIREFTPQDALLARCGKI